MEEQSMTIEDILSNNNLNRAYQQVINNNGAAGIDGMECKDLLSFENERCTAQGKRKEPNIQTNASKTGRNTQGRWK